MSDSDVNIESLCSSIQSQLQFRFGTHEITAPPKKKEEARIILRRTKKQRSLIASSIVLGVSFSDGNHITDSCCAQGQSLSTILYSQYPKTRRVPERTHPSSSTSSHPKSNNSQRFSPFISILPQTLSTLNNIHIVA